MNGIMIMFHGIYKMFYRWHFVGTLAKGAPVGISWLGGETSHQRTLAKRLLWVFPNWEEKQSSNELKPRGSCGYFLIGKRNKLPENSSQEAPVGIS